MKLRWILLVSLVAGVARGAAPVEVYRFGTAVLNERLTNRFLFHNESASPLAVTAVTPSCECVHVMNWPTNVEAGGVGVVDILYVPDKTGEVDYRVEVRTSSPTNPVFEYAIQGVVTGAPRARLDRDWALYLGTEEAGALLRDPSRALIVDVRSAQAYERARIPGSLNIPLFAVKTKGFLRRRQVVLVDEGFGSRALDEECRKLRETGFAGVSLWYGGLNAWRRRGGALEGLGSGEVDRVPPMALHDIGYATDWLAVTAGGVETNDFEGSLALACDAAKPEEFVAALNEAIKARPQVGSVLVATDRGEDYAAVAERAGRINAFVFYLEGGWTAWAAHRRMMGAIRQGQVASVQSGSGGGVRVRPGCGGCPK